MACPTLQELEAYATESAPAELRAQIEGHLTTCVSCRQRLERLRSDRDLEDDIRRAFTGQTELLSDERTDPPAPDWIPGYEITREIHRGGQGVVYQAIQKTTKRKVAIKVLREGPFAGKRDRARFEREVRILGQLQHPNIVTVHDSGMVRDHFYFVMDYISGEPLDAWLGGGERPIAETLELFAKICEAVSAAHFQGVIHRDLKPGNIRIDPEGRPHVLDFGLAKVAAGQTTDDSRPQAMTVTGVFQGTPAWASPEQVEAIPSKIDMRTDVYSLGVIFYQMLTGRFPYPVVGSDREVMDNILKGEPTRPSTVRREIDDEVETIVLKCLAKERERRYQSAGELGRDIQHYLNAEPIEAKRDSGLYVLSKTLRRYKGPVTVAAGFVLLLAVSLGISLSLWQRAARERDHAVAAERMARTAESVAEQKSREAEAEREKAKAASELAEEQRRAAEKAAVEAKTEASKATAVEQFLTSMLSSANPEQGKGADVTVIQVLDEAATKIDGAFPNQPAVEASIRYTIGVVYQSLGVLESAESHLATALRLRQEMTDADDLELADTMLELGKCRSDQTLIRKAGDIFRTKLGETHERYLKAMTYMKAGQGFGMVVFGLKLADMADGVGGLSKPQMLKFWDRFLETLRKNVHEGKTGAAQAQVRQLVGMLKLFPTKSIYLEADRGMVATANRLLEYEKDVASAELVMREALAFAREVHRDDRLRVADRLADLARFLADYDRGGDGEAKSLYAGALKIRRERMGSESPRVRELEEALQELEGGRGVLRAQTSQERLQDSDEYRTEQTNANSPEWNRVREAARKHIASSSRRREVGITILQLALEQPEGDESIEVSATRGRPPLRFYDERLKSSSAGHTLVRNNRFLVTEISTYSPRYGEVNRRGQRLQTRSIQIGTVTHCSPVIPLPFRRGEVVELGRVTLSRATEQEMGELRIRLQPEAGLGPGTGTISVGRLRASGCRESPIREDWTCEVGRVKAGRIYVKATAKRKFASEAMPVSVEPGQTRALHLPAHRVRQLEVDWWYRRPSTSGTWAQGTALLYTGEVWNVGSMWGFSPPRGVLWIRDWVGGPVLLQDYNCKWIPLEVEQLPGGVSEKVFAVDRPSLTKSVGEGSVFAARYRDSNGQEMDAILRVRKITPPLVSTLTRSPAKSRTDDFDPKDKLRAARRAESAAWRKLTGIIRGLRLDGTRHVRDIIPSETELAVGHVERATFPPYSGTQVEVAVTAKVSDVVDCLRALPDIKREPETLKLLDCRAIERLNKTKVLWAVGTAPVVPEGDAATKPSAEPRIVSAQARLLAKRRAAKDAYRKMMECVNGLQVNPKTFVKDFASGSGQMRNDLEAFVRGVQLGKPRWHDDGTCEVEAEVSVDVIITKLEQLHERHYKGNAVRPGDFQEMRQRIKRDRIRVVGMGAAVSQADAATKPPDSSPP